jgi:hypothetical protein
MSVRVVMSVIVVMVMVMSVALDVIAIGAVNVGRIGDRALLRHGASVSSIRASGRKD